MSAKKNRNTSTPLLEFSVEEHGKNLNVHVTGRRRWLAALVIVLGGILLNSDTFARLLDALGSLIN